MGVFREGPGKKKVLMVIAPLCSISVEGVIRRLRWGIGPKGGEAFSSHHIWMFIPSICTNIHPDFALWMDGQADRMNVHM